MLVRACESVHACVCVCGHWCVEVKGISLQLVILEVPRPKTVSIAPAHAHTLTHAHTHAHTRQAVASVVELQGRQSLKCTLRASAQQGSPREETGHSLCALALSVLFIKSREMRKR